MFSKAFKKGNPTIEPNKSFAASFNKKRKYSNWAREGLTAIINSGWPFGR